MEKLTSWLVPREEIAGLEITDSACRLILLARKNFAVRARAEVALLEGTVLGGDLKNGAALSQALRTLKLQAGKLFLRHPLAIVALSPINFYTHVIELPDMPETSYEEAARLNAMQISPIKLEEGYFDWQNLGVNIKTTGREFLIAAALKTKIDPFLDALTSAGIETVAIEPRSLSVMRLLTYFAATAEKTAPHLMISVDKDGLNFVIAKEGKPFFDQYTFWRDIEEAKDGEVTREEFEHIVTRETAKILTFYRTHHQEEVGSAVLMTPLLKTELAEVLNREFKLRIVGLLPPVENGKPLSDLWAGALGAALRGIIPRREDTIVSLMPEGTEAAYHRMRLAAFVSSWSRAITITLAGLLGFVGIIAVLLVKIERDLAATLAGIEQTSVVAETRDLETQASRFNVLVHAATLAEQHVVVWSPVLGSIIDGASVHAIRIQRLSLSGTTHEIRLAAFTTTRQHALDYTKSLDASQKFSLVDLPLGSFAPVAGGVTFSLTLRAL